LLGTAAPIAAALVGTSVAFILAAMVVVGYWIGYVWWIRSLNRPATPYVNRVHTDVLAAWLPLVRLTPVERAYCEVVTVLADDRTGLDDPTARDILQRVNGLVSQSRSVEQQRLATAQVVEEDAL